MAIARIAEADKKVTKAELEIKNLELTLVSRRSELEMQELQRQVVRQTGKQYETTSLK